MRRVSVCPNPGENAVAASRPFLDPIADLESSWRSRPGCGNSGHRRFLAAVMRKKCGRVVPNPIWWCILETIRKVAISKNWQMAITCQARCIGTLKQVKYWSKMKPPFVFQKVSNHGSANPIVARLAIQTFDLIQWLRAADDEKKMIIDNYLELQRRLLSCFDIHERLIAARRKALADAEKVWGQGQNTVPHVIGLQEEVESFLFAAKTYLREVARLLNNLFQANLADDSAIFWDPKGGDSRVAVWAQRRFGANHGTTKMLASEADWISEIIRKRNAVEHPEGKSGTLKITNFEARAEGVLPPLWAREGSDDALPSDIYKDIPIMMDNLLTMAEDLLVDAIHANPLFPQIIFARIPEEKRNPEAPVRINATVDLGQLQ